MPKKREIVIDSFAGGGGASLGILWATGREPDIAINHDEEAIAMHATNHPGTRHVKEDVWKIDPYAVTRGRKVGLLWASPDCKHFSRAKGGKPRSQNIRSLAWVVVKWAMTIQPRVIILENVREFADWGPLVPQWRCNACNWRGTEGQAVLMRTRRRCPQCESRRLKETSDMIPCPERKGSSFRRFTGTLKNLGYCVEYRNLDAADYGAPTHRKRLFLVARRDGEPIQWPEKTHGKMHDQRTGVHVRGGRGGTQGVFEFSEPIALKPYRTAAECIDWSIECPSIFDRKKPLAEKTLRRIAHGIKRYVLDNPQPFIVQTSHTGTTGRGNYFWSGDEPIRTLSQSSEFALASPVVVRYNSEKSVGDNRTANCDEPFSTLDTSNRLAIATPLLASLTHSGERRCIEPSEPLPTITTAHRGEVALIAPTLARQFGKSNGAAIDQPAPATMAGGGGKTALVSAFIAKHFGGMVGVEATTPLPTTTTRGTQNQVVAANLVHLNHGEKQWSGVDEPARTVTTGNHAALVYSFLVKYFGTAIGQELDVPMHTATGKARFGLITVEINGEPYVIVDIGMRMLTPRELARAQGFPDSYVLTGTKTSQVARIGNSVCPPIARAMVEANYCRKAVACG